MKLNVAIVGSNFGLRGYLPVIDKIKKLNLRVICSRNIKKLSDEISLKNVILEENWKKVFKNNIDLIILAVPPEIQEKILLYNVKFKKKIFFEKPISTNFYTSEKIINIYKKKKIKSEINLTYLNHDLFKELKLLIKKELLGKILNYKINWSVNSYDFWHGIKSWKTDEKKGGGLKNIFLTHILSYCEFLFGEYKIKKKKIKKSTNFIKGYKTDFFLNFIGSNRIKGTIRLYLKKLGFQNHEIIINFEKGCVKLFTKSQDWTKDFVLEISKKKKKQTIKTMKKSIFRDGRCLQIKNGIESFLKSKSSKNLYYCLNAEKKINLIH